LKRGGGDLGRSAALFAFYTRAADRMTLFGRLYAQEKGKAMNIITHAPVLWAMHFSPRWGAVFLRLSAVVLLVLGFLGFCNPARRIRCASKRTLDQIKWNPGFSRTCKVGAGEAALQS
jgi:hypothetical protein